MNNNVRSQKTRQKRKLRIRKNINGTADRPRVTVYRSNKYFYAQVIDDRAGKTLAAVKSKQNPTIETAKTLGETLGKAITKLKLEAVVFDRNGYNYHGRIAAFAEGLRAANIKL